MIRMARHVVIPDIMQMRTFAPRTAAAAPVGWWVVAGKTCVAAYQPKGAASYAASLSNLANPGIYDAAEGVQPGWAGATGWTFDGATQYLTTGITPASGWSGVGRWSGVTSSTGAIFGSETNTDDRFFLYPWFADGKHYYANGGYVGVAGVSAAGVMAIAGTEGYLNGVPDLVIGAWSGPGKAVLIGVWTSTDFPLLNYFSGNILAIAFYSDILTDGEVATLSTAIAAL